MELWNWRDLRSPPVNSVKVNRRDLDIINLKWIIDSTLIVFKNKSLLHREAAVLSRFVYKEKRRLRGHKSFIYLEKISRGLKRYFSLNLEQIFSDFGLLLPCASSSGQYEDWVYVPTKQMLEHLLIRIQSFAQIMNYIYNNCQIAAFHYQDTLYRGHIINDTMLGFSMISRIWVCSQFFIASACNWYSLLLPYLEKLKMIGICWLPENYKFPSNLGAWLGPNALTGELKLCSVNVGEIAQEIQTIEVKDIGVLTSREAYHTYHKRENLPVTKRSPAGNLTKYDKLLQTASENSLKSGGETSTDAGELIPRDQFSSLRKDTKQFSVVDEFSNNAFHLSKSCTQDSKPSITFEEDEKEIQCSQVSSSDLGELVSREHFLLQQTKTENISATKDKKDYSLKCKKKLNTVSLVNLKSDNLKSSKVTSRGTYKKESSENPADNVRELIDRNLVHSRRTKMSTVPCSEERSHSGEKDESSDKVCMIHYTLHDSECKRVSSMSRKKESSFNKTILQDSLLPTQEASTYTSHFIKQKPGNNLKEKSNYLHPFKTKVDTSSTYMPNVEGAQISNNILLVKKKKKQKCKSNVEQLPKVSEGRSHIVSSNRKKLKTKTTPNKEKIINEIRSVGDLKQFLHKEKGARKKGKDPFYPHLNRKAWNVCVHTISNIMRKGALLKKRGCKHSGLVMGEVRSYLVSLIT